MHTYYTLYNETTFEIRVISGTQITDLPTGFKTCKVYEKDGEAFNLGKKKHADYLVDVDQDGYAKFRHRYLYVVEKRFNNRDVIQADTIQDLDYRRIFFDHLNIKYSHDQDNITIQFELDALNSAYKETFIDSLKIGKKMSKIFVTEFQNTSALLSNFKLDLSVLTESKTITVPFKSDKHISLWGVSTHD